MRAMWGPNKKIGPDWFSRFDLKKILAKYIYRLLITRIIILVKNDRSNVDIRTRPRIPIPDEDPYSIAGNIQADPVYLYLTRTPTV